MVKEFKTIRELIEILSSKECKEFLDLPLLIDEVNLNSDPQYREITALVSLERNKKATGIMVY